MHKYKNSSKSLKTRATYQIIMLILFVLILLISSVSCNTTVDISQSNSTTKNTSTTINTSTHNIEPEYLYISIQAVIPDTGLKIMLLIKDSNALSLITGGNLNVKLWFQDEYLEKGFIIQEWNEIQIKKEDYNELSGVIVVLPYNETKSFPIDSYGILEVTLTLPDGNILDKELWKVPIAIEYRCCG